MSRRNNVRGPTSALTEFLRESGITPTTIARRVRTREAAAQEAVSGPSNAGQGATANVEQDETEQGEEYNSDNLDEDEMPSSKKRKASKAADSKAKGKGKSKATKKGADDDDDYQDSDKDPYTALSRMWKGDLPKPPVGSFEECAKCGKQFTVTKYTLAANPPPGWLCHPCTKASGADPFKKPAVPRKRKVPADKRVVVSFEERRFPSLASMCIQLISDHIDDVEALGDIGRLNMDEIAKAISRNRSLTPQNATLFYDVQSTELVLYDVTNLVPPALCTLAFLNPNLTHLRLDLCGRMDDSVIDAWCTSLPQLRRLELLGPFLVKAPAWQTFFKAHPALESFLITQSPRFDLECMRTLAENCSGLRQLRLKEVGKLDNAFLGHMKALAASLTYLDLSYPGNAQTLSEAALIDLMSIIAGSLKHLDLSGNVNIGDAFLFKGLKPYTKQLASLVLVNTPELTDAGVAEFFNTWSNPELRLADFSRDQELTGDALLALLSHSGASLTNLNVNGWKAVPQAALQQIAARAPGLRRLDIGFCREVDNWVVKELLQKCKELEEVKVWGCQRLTEECPRKRNVSVIGVEAHASV
ncbi:RNI-like protein [Laetiporus sulphureus 93-53]|uniref:RNI-like protein n=1 Tax=Laetiporus sulphureus 93-53 TaxID=1314785 RepID=A0A165CSZ2_9APHY|nr:RNI-like protein [Laetiporus sulphureus 93-53]KZT03383.1 RNI-like protein [Laetiporus sulphureus 93-53]